MLIKITRNKSRIGFMCEVQTLKCVLRSERCQIWSLRCDAKRELWNMKCKAKIGKKFCWIMNALKIWSQKNFISKIACWEKNDLLQPNKIPFQVRFLASLWPVLWNSRSVYCSCVRFADAAQSYPQRWSAIFSLALLPAFLAEINEFNDR